MWQVSWFQAWGLEEQEQLLLMGPPEEASVAGVFWAEAENPSTSLGFLVTSLSIHYKK